jgi:ssDNA-binding replication factor A large subunit
VKAFHDSLVLAERRGKSTCRALKIEIRARGDASSTYMFSVEDEPLAQATIKSASIRKLRKVPLEYSSILEQDAYRRGSRDVASPIQTDIGKMRVGQGGLSFKAHVVRKSEVRAVTTRDGTPLLVCSITLSDGTGQIPLAVWNSQINEISEGDLVEVQNARVRNFRGEIQLALSRKAGALRVLESAKARQQTVTVQQR